MRKLFSVIDVLLLDKGHTLSLSWKDWCSRKWRKEICSLKNRPFNQRKPPKNFFHYSLGVFKRKHLSQLLYSIAPSSFQDIALHLAWTKWNPRNTSSLNCRYTFSQKVGESEKVKVKSLSHVWLFATPWTVAYEAPPSMGFSRQECYLLSNKFGKSQVKLG